MTRIIGTLCLLVTALFGQAPDTLWTKRIGGQGDDGLFLVSQRVDLGFYLAGSESDTIFGDLILAALRIGPSGETVWHRRFAENQYGMCRTAIELNSGVLLLGGSLDDSLGRQPIVMAVDQSGDSAWSYARDSLDGGGCYALFEHSNGGIFCCFNTTFRFSGMGVHVTALSQDGELIWERFLVSSDLATRYEAFHIVEAQNGDIFIAGTFKPRPNFPHSIQERIWLMRMTSTGDSLWSTTYGISDWPHHPVSISLFANGNVGIIGLEHYNGDDPHRFALTYGQNGDLLEEHIYDDYVLWDVSACPSFGYVGITETSILDTSTFEVFTVPLLVRLGANGEIIWEQTYRMPFPYLNLYVGSILSLPNGGYACSGGILVENPFFSTDTYLFLTEPDLTNGIEPEQKPIVPTTFSVSAYPNPFNPSTTISFDLPQASQVELKVFNTLGQQVAELADEFYSAGQHQIAFDGAQLPSGLYLYSLSALTHSYTGKLLLLK